MTPDYMFRFLDPVSTGQRIIQIYPEDESLSEISRQLFGINHIAHERLHLSQEDSLFGEEEAADGMALSPSARLTLTNFTIPSLFVDPDKGGELLARGVKRDTRVKSFTRHIFEIVEIVETTLSEGQIRTLMGRPLDAASLKFVEKGDEWFVHLSTLRSLLGALICNDGRAVEFLGQHGMLGLGLFGRLMVYFDVTSAPAAVASIYARTVIPPGQMTPHKVSEIARLVLEEYPMEALKGALRLEDANGKTYEFTDPIQAGSVLTDADLTQFTLGPAYGPYPRLPARKGILASDIIRADLFTGLSPEPNPLSLPPDPSPGTWPVEFLFDGGVLLEKRRRTQTMAPKLSRVQRDQLLQAFAHQPE